LPLCGVTRYPPAFQVVGAQRNVGLQLLFHIFGNAFAPEEPGD